MENELEINKARVRIEEKMNELKVFDYNSLLIFASVAAIELQDKSLNWNFPEGFDYNTYAAKMLIKGAELSKQYQAKRNAEKSHVETYELKKQAIEYWCKNIDLKLSNDKAAAELTKIVPVSLRTLSGYIAEAKKQNIHPGSKV